MKEYDVTISETLEKTVSVTASSKEAAEEKVRQSYYNSEYVLDAENFTQVDFKVGDGREIAIEDNQIDVLLVKPGEFPKQWKVGTELEDLQAAVGGRMLPVIAGWLVMKIDALNEMLWDVVRS